MQTEDHRLAKDATLVFRAEAGDEVSFEELYRRYAPGAWRLALAVVAEHTDAATVLCQSFAKVFTLLRAGLRNPDEPFDQMLLTITRNTAIDHLRRLDEGADYGSEGPHQPRTRTLPADAADDLRPVADAFDRLPEQWRSVLWLCAVEDRSPRRTAPVLGLAGASTVQLAGRARQGLEEQYRSDQGETATDRVVERLPELTLPLPALLIDDARAAWTSVVTAPEASTTTGLSATTEKVLAGVSAVAAAVGVLGASLLGDGSSRSAGERAAPVAPIVTDEPARIPADLDDGVDVTAPAADPTGASTATNQGVGATRGTTGAGSRGAGPSGSDDVQGTSGSAPVAGDLGDAHSDEPAPTTTTTTPPPSTTIAEPRAEAPSDDESSGTPSVTVGITVADIPVAVEIGTQPGATVGPVAIGSEPTPADQPVEISGLGSLDPVLDPVLDAVGAVLGTLDTGL